VATRPWAALYTILETAKLHRLDPAQYLAAAVLAADRGETLLPWDFGGRARRRWGSATRIEWPRRRGAACPGWSVSAIERFAARLLPVVRHYGAEETGKKPYRPAELFEKWTWLQDACTSAGGATFSKTTTWPSALDEQRFR
jgi:hypothetical protein